MGTDSVSRQEHLNPWSHETRKKRDHRPEGREGRQTARRARRRNGERQIAHESANDDDDDDDTRNDEGDDKGDDNPRPGDPLRVPPPRGGRGREALERLPARYRPG